MPLFFWNACFSLDICLKQITSILGSGSRKSVQKISLCDPKATFVSFLFLCSLVFIVLYLKIKRGSAKHFHLVHLSTWSQKDNTQLHIDMYHMTKSLRTHCAFGPEDVILGLLVPIKGNNLAAVWGRPFPVSTMPLAHRRAP